MSERPDDEEAIVAVASSGPPPVEILGDGDLAARLRARLHETTSPTSGSPGTVVETTGTAAGIRDALTRVRDLGTVVVAGPAPGDAPTLDLYADLHVRGLTLIGVPPDAAAEAAG